MNDLMNDLIQELKRDEGFRSKPYVDCCYKYWRECTCKTKGRLTIGYGRNLDDVGILLEEAALMLDHDIAVAVSELRRRFDWFDHLSRPRQDTLIDMCVNLGIPRFMGFHKMLLALDKGDFHTAALEMLNSDWHDQLKKRVERLAQQLESDT